MISGLVSVIVPVYNRPQMIQRAVQSVLNQTYRPLEIIIVDDGSTDETPTILTELANAYPEIIRVLHQTNAGPGQARETGRQIAQGEYIQYLDSDDVLLPNKFTAQVAALVEQSSCDVAYGKTERLLDGTEPKGVVWGPTGTKMKTLFPYCLRSVWWATTTPLYRRTLTDKVGAWLPLSNEEDWEYDFRVASLGTQLAFVDEFVSLTYDHDAQLSTGGTLAPDKLKDRCVARKAMFKSMQRSRVAIPKADQAHFSKAVFLLARECAAANLPTQANDMVSLSIQINGRARLKHRLFKLGAILLGWKNAASLVHLLEGVR